MSKKALLAIALAVLLPLVSYMIVKYYGDTAIEMPRHYLPDSIIAHVDKGKLSTDTAWHVVQNIRLQNQLGDTVNLYDIQNKVIVCDFIFTSCGYMCPKLTQNMVKMQQSFIRGGDPMKKIDTSAVQFVSFSIDPERDSVSRLREYANKYGVDPDNWWLLTGNRDSIYNFIFQELKVDKYEATGPLDPNFAHTERFVLLDKKFNVRGFYKGLDTSSLAQLSKDIGLLMLEKATNPEPLPFDPVQMAIFFAITIAVTAIAISILFRKKKKNHA